jgi:FkbM family methyltransferase
MSGSPHSNDSKSAWLGNRFNWLGLLRALWVIANPFKFFTAILCQRVPATLAVRTPTGIITLTLRNFESLRTLFSIFCRKDYATPSNRPFSFYDIGANIGLAAAYFLSRNPDSQVRCFEPDEENLDWLKRNLEPFGGRATIVNCAVTLQTGEALLYRADDGRHSSMRQSAIAKTPQRVSTQGFAELLAEASGSSLPVVVKLDIEGLENELVASAKFEDHPRLSRLVCESTTCSTLITRPHRRVVRNGYIEDLRFGG